MISRLSSRSVFPAVMPTILPSRRADSGRAQDVDHEDQRGVGGDPAVGAAVGAVAELRGDLQHHPRADRYAVEALVPALDDGAGADAERGRLAGAGVAEVLVERLV